MNDEPHAEDLLRAVERFLEQDVVPTLDGVAKFHARVAANVVAIVAREIETEAAHAGAEWEGLSRLLDLDERLPEEREARRDALRGANAALVERIRSGDADRGPFRADLLEHLRRITTARLDVAQPPRQKG